jgi:hypothetical protein
MSRGRSAGQVFAIAVAVVGVAVVGAGVAGSLTRIGPALVALVAALPVTSQGVLAGVGVFVPVLTLVGAYALARSRSRPSEPDLEN